MRALVESQPAEMNSRNQSLDVLRGLAILLVLGRHGYYFQAWHKIGWIGVDLFFVLSGFLISGLLFREYKQTGTINLRRFIVRRGLRIWPPFYFFFGIVGILILFSGAQWRSLIMPGLFLQNYVSGTPVMVLSHTWSLAVEEHFYLMLPVLLFVMLRLRTDDEPFKWIPQTFLVITALSLFLRFLNHGDAWKSHLRMDELFAGVTLGYFFHFERKIFSKLAIRAAPALCLLFIAPAFVLDHDSRPMQTWGLSLLAIGFSFLLAWAVVRTPPRLLKPVTFVGFYSYSIYLWHYPVFILMRMSTASSLVIYLAYLVLCIGVGIAMAKLVEMPVLVLRDRFFPSPLNTLAPAITEERIPDPLIGVHSV